MRRRTRHNTVATLLHIDKKVYFDFKKFTKENKLTNAKIIEYMLRSLMEEDLEYKSYLVKCIKEFFKISKTYTREPDIETKYKV